MAKGSIRMISAHSSQQIYTRATNTQKVIIRKFIWNDATPCYVSSCFLFPQDKFVSSSDAILLLLKFWLSIDHCYLQFILFHFFLLFWNGYSVSFPVGLFGSSKPSACNTAPSRVMCFWITCGTSDSCFLSCQNQFEAELQQLRFRHQSESLLVLPTSFSPHLLVLISL